MQQRSAAPVASSAASRRRIIAPHHGGGSADAPPGADNQPLAGKGVIPMRAMEQQEQQAIVVADLGYGDAGKGSTVDYLARATAAHTVIRYNGGAQAAHNVVTPGGLHHTFSQFGSATFVPGVS